MTDNQQAQAIQSQWWEPLWEFCAHVVVGTGIFLIVAFPAVLLDLLVSWLAEKALSQYVLIGLLIVEYVLFAVDIVLFLIFMVRTAWRTHRRLLLAGVE